MFTFCGRDGNLSNLVNGELVDKWGHKIWNFSSGQQR